MNKKNILDIFPSRNNGESWTKYEDKIVMDRNKTDQEIAFITGRSVNAIRSRRCKISKIGRLM